MWSRKDFIQPKILQYAGLVLFAVQVAGYFATGRASPILAGITTMLLSASWIGASRRDFRDAVRSDDKEGPWS